MNLTPQDEHYVRAAEGWLDLDEALEAAGELEAIPIGSRSHPAVLLQYCRLYLDTHRPEYTHLLATSLTKYVPDLPDGWFYLACAHARLNRLDDAYAALKQCFIVAIRRNSEQEWQKRTLASRDLERLWCASQNG